MVTLVVTFREFVKDRRRGVQCSAEEISKDESPLEQLHAHIAGKLIKAQMQTVGELTALVVGAKPPEYTTIEIDPAKKAGEPGKDGG